LINRRILIDSSGGESTLDEYINVLTNELNKQKCSLQEILITHWHWDHTEGVQAIIKSITKQNITVSKYPLVNRPEHDTITKYNYIKDNHTFHTEGATLK
jgi:metal-dependent hydrolase (beta-lactamase superfamily II)